LIPANGRRWILSWPRRARGEKNIVRYNELKQQGRRALEKALEINSLLDSDCRRLLEESKKK